MIIKQLPSGFHILEDSCIGKFQVETGELCHDRHLVPFACEQFSAGSTCIDVGALCGDHSYEYSQKIGKKGTLICIEPCLPAFDCLRFNMQVALCKVICINAAASDSHGAVLYHKMNQDNVGASTVEVLKSEKVDEIRSVSIDGLYADGSIKRCDFIKIDVEGFELKVLQGAREIILKHKPRLLIEINEARLKDNGSTPLEIYNFLAGVEYLYDIIQPQSKLGDPQFDILAYHKDVKEPEFPIDRSPQP